MTLIQAEYGRSPSHEVRRWGDIKNGYTHFQDGDVVMAKITSCFENGKSAIMDGLENGVGAGTTELHVFRREIPVVLPQFVLIYIKSRGFIERGIPRMTGSAGQKRVPSDYFANSPFPLPPLAEQRRIVAKVDELMAVCDRLEAQQREGDARRAALARAALARFAAAPTRDNLRYLFHPAYDIAPAELRAMILQLAIRGSLIPFVPIGGRQVGDHLEFLNGYAFKSEWFRNNGIHLCRNVNVGHGTLNWGDKACVDEARAHEFSRFALQRGDIVISLDRPIISTGLKAARVQQNDLPCLLLQRVAKPIPKHSDVDLDFLFWWLNSPAFRDLIDPGRSNGVPHISTKEVQRLPLALPPFDVQRAIVAKVAHLMPLVDRYESLLANARTTAARLLDALVAELTGTVRRASIGKAERHADPAEMKRVPDKAPALRPAPSASPASAGRPSRAATRPSEDSEALLDLLRSRGSCSSSEAQAATGLDPATLRSLFKTLIDQGLVRTEGQRRGMRYLPTAKAAHAQ